MTTITTTTHQPMVPQRTEFVARPPAAPAGVTAADLLGVVRRRVVLIFFVFVFLCGATVGLTYVWLRFWPSFTASAYVEIQPPRYDPFEVAARETSEDVMERMQIDQRYLATSDRVLQTALKDPAVKNTLWYHQAGATTDEIILQFRDDLNAWPIKESSLLEIRMSTKYQEEVHNIVNTVTMAYVEEANRMTSGPYARQIEFYTDERSRLADEITTKRNAIEAFRKQVNVPNMTQGQTIIGDRLLRISALVTELDTVKTRLQATHEQYQNVRAEDVEPDEAMVIQVESDPRVLTLQSRESALAEEYAVQNRSGLGPNHPYLKEILGRMEVVNAKLNQTRQQLLTDLRRAQMDQTRIAYTNAQHQLYLMMEQLEAAKADQADLDRNLAAHDSMVQELEQMMDELQMVTEHVNNLRLLGRDPEAQTVRILNEATRPRERAAPRWETNLPAGFALALLLSFGLAFFLEFIDTSIRTPRDVVRHTAMPLLGAVPVLDDEEIRIDDVEMVTRTAPHSLMAESFRQVRTSLLFSCPAEQQRAVLVTSPSPADGKTAVAINLAVSVAQGGRRVLLVDANMRRPTLHNAFTQRANRGLSNILIGQGQLEDYVTTTDLPNLDVLAAGPTPPSPAELLGTAYMRDLLTKAVDRYDQVILDGPPILLVSDALVLATTVDGVIIVCRAKANSRGVIQRTRTQLERVGAHILGVVLNAVESTRGGYFRKQYRAFYEYQPEEEEGVPPLELPPSDAPKVEAPKDEVPQEPGADQDTGEKKD